MPLDPVARGISIHYTSLTLRQDNFIATVTLDRPDDGNKVDKRLASELRQVLEELSKQDHLRLIILTANGTVFSAGRDEFSQTASNLTSEEWLAKQRVASAMAEVPVPVIVALNGDATDHGLELALSGDLRLAVADAKLGFSPPSGKRFPWDGGTQRLPRLIGPAWARDMLLTGRMLDASQACSIGLVNRVAKSVDDLRRITSEVADKVAAGGPLGARYAKEAITKGMDLTLDQGLRLEADLNIILQSTRDRSEGIDSFREKRSPKFTGEQTP